MKTLKQIPTTDFGKLNIHLKRVPKWNEAIESKMKIAQKTLNSSNTANIA